MRYAFPDFFRLYVETCRENNPGFSKILTLFESGLFSSNSAVDKFEVTLFKILIPRRFNPSNEIIFSIADFLKNES